MIIKYQALTAHLQKKRTAVYVLMGQEHYLLNEAAVSIKKAFASPEEREDKIMDITSSDDWLKAFEEANSYALFVDRIFIDIRYEKKSLDAIGQKRLKAYLEHPNDRSLILIRAPEITNKSIQALAQHANLTVVQAYPLSAAALQTWINQQLKLKQIRFEENIPFYIHQYMQHNMLACAQCIEKIAITYVPETVLTLNNIQDHLFDQCDYSLYELADAFLLGDSVKAIHLLRSHQHRNEAPLILWILTQEIRHLLQLETSKIRPDRLSLYKKALNRFTDISELQKILFDCQKIDEQIKSGQMTIAWHGLERIASL